MDRKASKAERRESRATVGAYHEEQLTILLQHVAGALERFRAGELDAFEMDRVMFQYSRAAKELWKFCELGDYGTTARWIREEHPGGWWERGEPRRRD